MHTHIHIHTHTHTHTFICRHYLNILGLLFRIKLAPYYIIFMHY